MRTGTDSLITIRKLRREDKEPIQRILEETDVFTSEEIGVAVELIDICLNDADQQDYEIVTAADGSETVGYICTGATPLTAGTFDLYWIAVKPSRHSQGIGRQLLRHAEEDILSKGGRLLISETSSMATYEPTRLFYVKNGFREVARIRDYYKKEDDLLIYGKYLSQSEGT